MNERLPYFRQMSCEQLHARRAELSAGYCPDCKEKRPCWCDGTWSGAYETNHIENELYARYGYFPGPHTIHMILTPGDIIAFSNLNPTKP